MNDQVNDTLATGSEPPSFASVNVGGIEIAWYSNTGSCTFNGLPVAAMWVDTTLAGLMSGAQAMAGTERFALTLQSEGRQSIENDWAVISRYDDFRDGFQAIADIAAKAGWGEWSIEQLDLDAREVRFRVRDGWEGRYQKALGVCWDSAMLAGKMAGYCTRLFGMNCWAEQTAHIATGDPWDKFLVRPSKRSIEHEIEQLPTTDPWSPAALKPPKTEVRKRQDVEAALRAENQKNQILLRRASDGIHILDERGNLVEASDSFFHMLGYTREELISRNVASWDANFSQEKLDTMLERQLHSPMRVEFETRHCRKDGTVIEVEVSGYPVTLDGQPHIFNSSRDITARKRSDRELQNADQELDRERSFLKTLVQSIPDLIWLKDPNGVYLACNREFERFFGKPEASIVGNTDYDFVDRDLADFFRNNDRAAMSAGGPTVNEEWITYANDGHRALLRTTKTPMRGNDGSLIGVLGIAHDITQMRHNEEELVKSRRTLQQAQAVAQVGSWTLDILADSLAWSDETYRIFGLPVGTPLTLETFVDCLHPDDRPMVLEAWNAALRGAPYDIEHRILVEGRTRWLRERAELEFSSAGKPLAGVGIVQDITNRKQAEEALRRSEERHRTILDSVDAFIYLKDTEGRYLFANAAVRELWKASADDIVGVGDEKFFDAESSANIRHNDRQVLVEGKTLRVEETNTVSATGKTATYQSVKLPLRHAGGSIYALCGISTDVTDRNRMETALRQSEERFRKLFDSSPDPVWIIDKHLFVECNQAAVDMLRYPDKQSLTNTHPSALSPQYQPDGESSHRKAERMMDIAQQRGSNRFEWVHRRADGSDFFAEVTLSPMTLQDRPVIYCVWRDITERKKVEDELQTHKKHLEALVAERTAQLEGTLRQIRDTYVAMDHAGFATFWVDLPSYRIIDANDHATAILGYSKKELLHLSISEIDPNFDLEAVTQIAATLRQQRHMRFESTQRHRDGHQIPVEVTLYYLEDETQQSTKVLAICTDISERKRTEEALRASELRFRHLFDSSNDALMISEPPDWSFTTTNEATRRLFAASSVEKFTELGPWDISPEFQPDGRQSSEKGKEHIESAMRDGACSFEWVHKRLDGEPFHADVLLTRMTVGERTFLQATVRDISQRKAMEHALEVAKANAEATSRSKSEFLANMSHEIRTPMNAVLGLAQVLEGMQLSVEAHQLVEKLRISGQTLLGIINDILDFSKIEAGRLETEVAPFALADVLDNLATVMATNAKGKNLELVLVPPVQHPLCLLGDELRLGQILSNLANNAIKFTDKGSVEVRIEVDSETDREVTLRFTVRDTGIGMDEATRARLFQPFTQADATTTRRFGGTGLGLVIVRRLVDLLGGEMGIDSTLDVGTTFWFTLAFPYQPPTDHPFQDLGGLQIFIADENPLALEALGTNVRSLGGSPHSAVSDDAILDHLLQEPRWHDPNAVLLLSRQVGERSGLDIARAIRDIVPGDRQPMIILVTGLGPGEAMVEQESHIVDGVLSKPVSPSMLYTAITQARARREGDLVPDPITSDNPLPLTGLRLLVVDDSEINREVAEHIFSSAGAQISHAANGQDALDRLFAHPGAVDLVLMDVHMPIMDGLEATRRLRERPEFAQLPVVALTAGAFQEQKDAALAAGMADFITKPFVVDRAIAQILSLTRPHSAYLRATRIEPANGPMSPGPHAVLNTQRGLELIRDPQRYARVLRMFADQYRTEHERLAAAETDAETLQELAHKLRGSAGNLGMEQVAASAALVETQVRQGQDPRHARVQLLDDMARAFDAIETFTRQYATDRPARQPVETTPDAEKLTRLLLQALSAFEDFDPTAAEEPLRALQPLVGDQRLDSMQRAVAAFHSTAGAEAVRQLARDLGISLEP